MCCRGPPKWVASVKKGTFDLKRTDERFRIGPTTIVMARVVAGGAAMKRHRLSAIVGAALLAGSWGCGSRTRESKATPGAAPAAVQVAPPAPRLHLEPATVTLAPEDFGAQFLAEDRDAGAKAGRDVTAEVAWSV